MQAKFSVCVTLRSRGGSIRPKVLDVTFLVLLLGLFVITVGNGLLRQHPAPLDVVRRLVIGAPREGP